MSAIQASAVSVTPTSGLSAWMKRHPLIAYFSMAYAFTWILVIPITLSQRGLGLFSLPEGLLFALFLLSTFSGPLPAALLLTSLIDGPAGRRQLLRRMFQWRVGARWYLLVLVGYPIAFLIGMTFSFGPAPWIALSQQWPLIFTFYLPTAALGIIFPGLGEEPGWRGFALPRLQQQYGPLGGSLILGTLHGLWHLPAYFIPGAILDGPFNFTVFAANTLSIIALTLIWTWLFNNAGQSVLFAMFVHGMSNAVSGLIPRLMEDTPSDPWFGLKVGAAVALLIIAFTRGRLGYQPTASQNELVTDPTQDRSA
jgi:membrane protease YdiL (CAAX protease family)